MRSLSQCTHLIWFFHLLFNSIATPCLLTNWPDSTMMCPCCVSHTSLFWRHVSEISITSQSTRYSSLISSSNRSFELNDLMFFCSTVNVVLCDSSLRLWGEVLLLLPLHSPSFLKESMSSFLAASAFPSLCGIVSPMPAAASTFSSFLHFLSLVMYCLLLSFILKEIWIRFFSSLFIFFILHLGVTTRSHLVNSSLHPELATAHSRCN